MAIAHAFLTRLTGRTWIKFESELQSNELFVLNIVPSKRMQLTFTGMRCKHFIVHNYSIKLHPIEFWNSHNHAVCISSLFCLSLRESLQVWALMRQDNSLKIFEVLNLQPFSVLSYIDDPKVSHNCSTKTILLLSHISLFGDTTRSCRFDIVVGSPQNVCFNLMYCPLFEGQPEPLPTAIQS